MFHPWDRALYLGDCLHPSFTRSPTNHHRAVNGTRLHSAKRALTSILRASPARAALKMLCAMPCAQPCAPHSKTCLQSKHLHCACMFVACVDLSARTLTLESWMQTAQTRRTSFLNLANWRQPLQVREAGEGGQPVGEGSRRVRAAGRGLQLGRAPCVASASSTRHLETSPGDACCSRR